MDIIKALEMERFLSEQIWKRIDALITIKVNKYYQVYGYKTFFDFCKNEFEKSLKNLPDNDPEFVLGLRIGEARTMLEIGFDHFSTAKISGLALDKVMKLKPISEDGRDAGKN